MSSADSAVTTSRIVSAWMSPASCFSAADSSPVTIGATARRVQPNAVVAASKRTAVSDNAVTRRNVSDSDVFAFIGDDLVLQSPVVLVASEKTVFGSRPAFLQFEEKREI